jgi:hypothetical protein
MSAITLFNTYGSNPIGQGTPQPPPSLVGMNPCEKADVGCKKGSSTTFHAEHIPSSCLKVFKDAGWMSFFNDLFGIASSACALIGRDAAKFVPFLIIASAPVYLYHEVRDASARFKLISTAYKTSRVADFFFNCGKGVSAAGAVLSDLITPLVGMSKLTTVFNSMQWILSSVFPIILFVCNVIGGVTQGWSLGRSVETLRKFRQKREGLDGSLKSMVKCLSYLQGPQQKEDAAYELKVNRFNENHFTSDLRKDVIQKRIKVLLALNSESKMSSAQEETLREAIGLIEGGEQLFDVLDPKKFTPFERIDKMLDLCDHLLPIVRRRGSQEPTNERIVQLLERVQKDLTNLKSTLYNEGLDITEVVRTEIECKLAGHAITLLSACIALVATLFFLYFPNYQTEALALGLVATALNASNTISNKCDFYERFEQTEPFIQLLRDQLQREQSHSQCGLDAPPAPA